MGRLCVLFLYFVFLDCVCLNIGLWSALVVFVSAAILLVVHTKTALKKAVQPGATL